MKFLPFRKHRLKPRPYLLLEVIIAFALISLCLFPLVSPHFKLIQNENSYSEKMQLERIANSCFLKLKEKLYQHEIAWEDLKKGCSGQLSGNWPLFLSNKTLREYQCSYQMSMADSTHKAKGGSFLLLDIELILKAGNYPSKSFKYAITVKNNET